MRLLKRSCVWLSFLFVVVVGAGNLCSFLLLSQPQYQSSSHLFLCESFISFWFDSSHCNSFTQNYNVVVVFKGTCTRYRPCTDLFVLCNFLGNSSNCVSAFVFSVMSIDRFLALTFPLKAKLWFSVKQAKITTACITVFFTIVHLPVQFSLPKENRPSPIYILLSLQTTGRNIHIGRISSLFLIQKVFTVRRFGIGFSLFWQYCNYGMNFYA
jgi:hypothetical protein